MKTQTIIVFILVAIAVLLATSHIHCAQAANGNLTFKQKASIKYDAVKDSASRKYGEVKESASKALDDFVALLTGTKKTEQPVAPKTDVSKNVSATKSASNTGEQGKIQQNAEKLGEVEDKAEQLNENSSDFASAARRLREREQKRGFLGF